MPAPMWSGDAAGNFSADPGFCNRRDGVYTLQEGSPCLPENNPTGRQIGESGLGCSAVVGRLELSPTKLNESARGQISATLFGDGEFAPGDIDPTTVLLQGVVSPNEPTSGPETSTSPGSQFGKARVASFAFDAQDVIAALRPIKEGDVRPVVLCAQLRDGKPVRATQDVRVVNTVKEPPNRSVVRGEVVFCARNRVVLVGDDGSSHVIASGGALENADGLVLDDNADIIVSDYGRYGSAQIGKIIRIDPKSGEQTIITSGGHIVSPDGITLDHNGDILVCVNPTDANDDPLGKIVRVDPKDGTQTVAFDPGREWGASSCVMDRDGMLWVSVIVHDWGRPPQPDPLVRIDLESGELTTVDELRSHTDLLIDKKGRLVVVDRLSDSITRLTPTGNLDVVSSGGLLKYPGSVAVDNDGDYLVVSNDNRIIRVSATDGRQSLYLTAAEEEYIGDMILLPPNKIDHAPPKVGGTSGLEAQSQPPRVTPGIASINPNPFNPVARIHFGVVQGGTVDLAVYDVAGRLVARLVHQTLPGGGHEVTWEAGDIASGVYFARLQTPDGTYTRKLVVTK
jgi:sugar lactone lactonase YvrE